MWEYMLFFVISVYVRLCMCVHGCVGCAGVCTTHTSMSGICVCVFMPISMALLLVDLRQVCQT